MTLTKIRPEDHLPPPYEPVEIDDVFLAFPADVYPLMPREEEIPEEFKLHFGNEWLRITESWFFSGLGDEVKFWWKPGINPETATRHLKAILGSYQPKHQYKIQAIAFLMSIWFDKVEDWEP
jgi:hypothetical protein